MCYCVEFLIMPNASPNKKFLSFEIIIMPPVELNKKIDMFIESIESMREFEPLDWDQTETISKIILNKLNHLNWNK